MVICKKPPSKRPRKQSSASCEYCCPLCPTGALYWENSFYLAPRGKLAQESCAGCPQQRDATGKPDKDQKRDRVGKPGLQDMWLNVVLGSLPRSQSSGTGPSSSCGYCCPLCPTGVSIRENSFYRAPGGIWAQETRAGAPAAVPQGRAEQSSETGLCGDWRMVLLVPGPRDQYSGNICFIEKHGVQDWGRGGMLPNFLTPGYPPRSQSSGTQPSASCGHCCPLCPTGG